MKKKQSPLRFVVILTVLAALLLVAIVFINNRTNESSTTLKKQPSIEGQPIMGKKNAPVTIVEFGDYKCPSCKALTKKIIPKLEKDYINTGKAKLSYVNVLFHGTGSKYAALASEQVWKEDPKSFWKFHQALFDAQPDNSSQEWVTPALLGKIAGKTTNIKPDSLTQGVLKGKMSDAVKKDSNLNKEFDIQSTPTLIINSTKVGDPFDYKEITKIIDKELKGKK